MMKVYTEGPAAMADSMTRALALIDPSPFASKGTKDFKLKDMVILGTYVLASTVAMFGWISALGWLAYRLVWS